MRIQKWMSVAAVVAAITFLAATAATARRIPDTPLYMYRMETQSSEMDFLPTAVNGFTYSTEKGSTLQYGFVDGSNVVSIFDILPVLDTGPPCQDTYWVTCVHTEKFTCKQAYDTCLGGVCLGYTHQDTCGWTCCDIFCS